ncbi:hypothetical protein JQN72_09085 [Phycicoccus sp. CSK15P-2]|uniref:hypothetical protein n=1 Tax=Phycicoccus sp. CSK15P-2 TaxID=2807627 RepID=UPI00195097F2|nr:hypothetical protein [Phycicoccus sp. CSK15P-2]MBM6404392.1 hypothetical protein [Phycicoccus sp. CSK15P-2]
MRWEGLFADLEGQMAAEERRDLDSEVAERTRRERALVELPARFAAGLGRRTGVVLAGGRGIEGELRDVGDGWLLLGAGHREVLVPLAAVAAVTGLPPSSEKARTARRFGLGYALRALARDRATVWVELSGGPPVVGTIDVVGADHLVLAEHPEGEPRRPENVRRMLTVPTAALRAVESRR